MNLRRRYYNSIETHICLGKWWLYLLFLPSVLFSQFHVVGDIKVTINSDVIVSKPDSSLVHTVIEQKETAKIYVVEGTKIYGFEQTTSNQISYIKTEPKPKAEDENRRVAKKERYCKKYSENPKVAKDKKPDAFKIVPVSLPSGSFSSAFLSQEAVLPLVKRLKTSIEGKLLFYETYKIVLPDDFYISGYFPHTVFCNLRYCGKKWTSRPPPFSV